jgi:hypothetical protein
MIWFEALVDQLFDLPVPNVRLRRLTFLPPSKVCVGDPDDAPFALETDEAQRQGRGHSGRGAAGASLNGFGAVVIYSESLMSLRDAMKEI